MSCQHLLSKGARPEIESRDRLNAIDYAQGLLRQLQEVSKADKQKKKIMLQILISLK